MLETAPYGISAGEVIIAEPEATGMAIALSVFLVYTLVAELVVPWSMRAAHAVRERRAGHCTSHEH